MSTGKINYFEIRLIAEKLQQELDDYKVLSESFQMKKALIDIFNDAITALAEAEVYARNIDKLLDGDITEEDLICRTRRELDNLKIDFRI